MNNLSQKLSRSELPDVSVTEQAQARGALSNVGMSAIDLPVRLADPLERPSVAARISSTVNLPDPDIKGIHMSRLYRLLLPLGDDQALSPRALVGLLQGMVTSHISCATTTADLSFSFNLLMRKPALETPEISGWSHYPVHIEASLKEDTTNIHLTVSVGYSSTCPCSAALSRQLVAERFVDDFQQRTNDINIESVTAWLKENATYATPHSQRSRADVRVRINADAEHFGIATLIHQIEDALKTPLQTAVKRPDEQAFAKLNGNNLMFVEDAVRRLSSALSDKYQDLSIDVGHFESLHPHDAVARFSA